MKCMRRSKKNPLWAHQRRLNSKSQCQLKVADKILKFMLKLQQLYKLALEDGKIMYYDSLCCSWEKSSRSDVFDTKIQENIRLRERVIVSLDSPNLDIHSSPSDDNEDSKNEEYSWERVVSFGFKVKKKCSCMQGGPIISEVPF